MTRFSVTFLGLLLWCSACSKAKDGFPFEPSADDQTPIFTAIRLGMSPEEVKQAVLSMNDYGLECGQTQEKVTSESMTRDGERHIEETVVTRTRCASFPWKGKTIPGAVRFKFDYERGKLKEVEFSIGPTPEIPKCEEILSYVRQHYPSLKPREGKRCEDMDLESSNREIEIRWRDQMVKIEFELED